MKYRMKAICWMFLLCPALASAQESRFMRWQQSDNDTSYVEDLTRELTVRVYGSRKYNYYDMHDRRIGRKFFTAPMRITT